jgi:valyl-tRNA synthetase
LDAYEHSKALEAIETFFWQFCDDYIELAKNRAYGTADATGLVPSEQAVRSARTTLGLVLDAFARLFAPYLPFACEEVWGWMHEGSASVHLASWPTPEAYEQACGDVRPDVLVWAGQALAELRKIKSEAKVSMKTPILSAKLAVPPEAIAAVREAQGDIAEAGRVTGELHFVEADAADGAAEQSDETTISVVDSTLGEPPVKKPKR